MVFYGRARGRESSLPPQSWVKSAPSSDKFNFNYATEFRVFALEQNDGAMQCTLTVTIDNGTAGDPRGDLNESANETFDLLCLEDRS